MGAGRSGTTLLDIMIGNADGIFSCGELVRYPELRSRPHGFDKDTDTYRFWGTVANRFATYYDGKPDFVRLEKVASKVDYHRAFLFNFIGVIPRQIKGEYRRYVTSLYDSIFSCIEESIIVDSSKYPSRALALGGIDDYEISIIYLVRHPAMVARSFAIKGIEQPSKNALAFNIYYFLVNMACTLVRWRLRNIPFVKVRYEDIIADPVGQLEYIQSVLPVDLSRSINLLASNKELDVGRIFEGNRIRLKERIRVRTGDVTRAEGLKAWIATFCNGYWWRWN